MYHGTHAEWESFVEKGILAGPNWNVYLRQAPYLRSVGYRYTIEVEVSLSEVYPHGCSTKYPEAAYEHPEWNVYERNGKHYGVWTSGGADLAPEKIVSIVDNKTAEVVYQRGG
jgi:hypothetical protein